MPKHEDAKERTPARRDIPPLCAWVTKDERDAIIANAEACGLSTSAYMRNLALGHTPASILDLKEMGNLIATRADLGRLGGLLKMWLTDEIRFNEVYQGTIDDLLDELDASQKKLMAVIHRIDREKR